MQIIGERGSFLFVNIYSPQHLEEKLLLLRQLTSLHHRHNTSQAIYGGDFNMITSLEENKGGTRALCNDAQAFNAFIQDLSLVDIKPSNGMFTWTNRQGGDRLIASRLDRFLVSESLLLEGNIISSEILPSGGDRKSVV